MPLYRRVDRTDSAGSVGKDRSGMEDAGGEPDLPIPNSRTRGSLSGARAAALGKEGLPRCVLCGGLVERAGDADHGRRVRGAIRAG